MQPLPSTLCSNIKYTNCPPSGLSRVSCLGRSLPLQTPEPAQQALLEVTSGGAGGRARHGADARAPLTDEHRGDTLTLDVPLAPLLLWLLLLVLRHHLVLAAPLGVADGPGPPPDAGGGLAGLAGLALVVDGIARLALALQVIGIVLLGGRVLVRIKSPNVCVCVCVGRGGEGG